MDFESTNLQATTEETEWMVAHVRPRCEKKLVEFCGRQGFASTLPLYKSVKKYRGKQVTFEKPLFPGYVFLKILKTQRQKAYQSDYVANLLEVVDQATFKEQLDDILNALETEYEICLMPHISEGKRVRIKAGPLRGMEGFVQERQGVTLVLLRLDFIAQAAGVKVEATDLEVVD